MTIDLTRTGHCIIEILDTSMNALGSLFLVSWNANVYRIISGESITESTNPRRPENGSTQVTLSNLNVGQSYSLKAVFLD